MATNTKSNILLEVEDKRTLSVEYKFRSVKETDTKYKDKTTVPPINDKTLKMSPSFV